MKMLEKSSCEECANPKTPVADDKLNFKSLKKAV